MDAAFPDPMPAIHRYRISGLVCHLPFALAHVAPGRDGEEALGRFTARLGKVAPPPLSPPWRAAGLGMWGRPGAALLTVTGVGRFLAEGAQGLVMDIEPGAEPLAVEQYLTGHVMGAMLHLADILPLHASCLARDGVAVAIMATKGTGKSTLAAALGARGWTPLADDVTAVAPGADGEIRAWPGPARFRLSPASLDALGLAPDEGLAVPGLDKRLAAGPWQTDPVRLAAIVELTAGGEGAPRAVRLPPAQALAAMDAKTFRRRLVEPLEIGPAHIQRCMGLATRVGVYSLKRPAGLDRLDQLAAEVEAVALGRRD